MDNVGSWAVLLIFAIIAMVAVFIKAVNEEDARRKENERYWDEHGWGD